jgi:hypothetical protein
MNVYTIVFERLDIGEPSLSILTRQDNEQAAYAYAETVIAQSPVLQVAEIHVRTSDAYTERERDHHALHLIS